MGDWCRRDVDGPTADLLSASDVARLFGISEDTLKRLIAEGEFPAPLLIGKQTRVWDWESVAYYRLRLKLTARIEPKPTATGVKPNATEG